MMQLRYRGRSAIEQFAVIVRRRGRRWPVCACIVLGVALFGLTGELAGAGLARGSGFGPAGKASAVTKANSKSPAVLDQKRVCVMSQKTVAGVRAFATLVDRRTVDCASVYTASPDWAGWVDPWFLHHPDPDLNWAAWVRRSPADDRRELIISQPLIPSYLASTNWRSAGAHGAYTSYAKEFARELVAYGVGDAVIRLSWEMNGTWTIDNIGDSRTQIREWVAFWRRTVLAMRSVHGAHFKFVWCVGDLMRDIPFAEYYPGNDVVDIIGDDVYDAGISAGRPRWGTAYNSPGGLSDLIAFARAHHKPLSIPEWGVGVPDGHNLAGGDDPAFVNGLAHVVAHNDVAFQTYFFAHEWATELASGPEVLAAYRRHFGARGDSVGSDDGTAIVPPRRRRKRPGTR